MAAPAHFPPTWTRTITEQDALLLLDLARPGQTLAEWADLAHATLVQPNHRNRLALIRVVSNHLLDHDGRVVLDSGYLRLLRGGSPHLRSGLVLGRLCAFRPLVEAVLDHLIRPALARGDEPLRPAGAADLPSAAWDKVLLGFLPPGTGPEAFTKTRNTLQRTFAQIGNVEEANGHALRACHGRPDPLAFCWLLGHELVEQGRTEAPEAWALDQSFAVRLFAPRPAYAATSLEAGIAARLLRRGYLAGTPRLHPGPALLAGGEG